MTTDRATRAPLWYRILWFFQRAPEAIPRAHWFLLGVLGVSFLLNQYDMALLGIALPQIQRGLGVSEEELGPLLANVRLGVLPGLALAVLADRYGRRRLLLLTIVGFTVCTTLTAFARTATEFATLQFLARTFIAAEEMLAIVVVAEELDARVRGWALGLLAGFGALGHGLAAGVFASVNVVPFGWRALYAFGVLPLLLLAWIRRGLRETRRYETDAAQRGSSTSLREILQPVVEVVRLYPGRMLLLCGAVFPFAFAIMSALSFVSKTLQDVHGYLPQHISIIFLTLGVLVFAATILVGRLGDRFGRKRVMIIGITTTALAVAFFYNASGPLILAAWTAMMFAFVGMDVLFGALGTELFPTSYRSTASGIRSVVATLGGALGLFVEGQLYSAAGSHGGAITWMIPVALLAPLAIAFLPETARRELEDIAPGEIPEGAET